ncbi:MAG: 50S ribosomal protein L6 [Christensenellaceae bacterium]|jgi:ribosomal protein L6|nr:50S ribosomal protein L6 [Christensenellaceae bacterium]MBS6563891.1 50S ribosomal protein L6 [Clostridiales bacterium]PWM00577.1 MAG: 50S ribosomal protein L6 [Selenomonadales bacterium]
MSRIGKLPVIVPAGVTVTVDADNNVTVKGPKGTLTESISKEIEIKQENGQLLIERKGDAKLQRSLHGLSRTLINNMVTGVTSGYEKTLEIQGVGYRAAKQGKKLVLSVGYSHPVEIEENADITIEVPAQNKIVIKGINKQKVGQFAADVRGVRKPEVYHGKGIRYEGEYVPLKEGKTGKK